MIATRLFKKSIVAGAFLGSMNLLGLQNQAQAATDLSSSPALAAICADGVTPHPKWAGYWHIDRPHFVATESAVFATMDLPPTAAGEYAVVRIDRAQSDNYSEVARFAEPIRDLKVHDGKVWVLFADQFVALEPTTGARLVDSQKTSLQAIASEDASAQSFVWLGQQLVIAHGTQGFTVYDAKAARLTSANPLGLAVNGQQSKVVDVTAVDENHALFAVEAVTLEKEAPFTFDGLILADLNGSVERFGYDRATAGVISNARVSVSGDTVLINNWGILQKASLASMRQAGQALVSWTPVAFAHDGRNEPGELLGDLMVDGGKVISCAQFSYQDAQTNHVLHKGVVYTGTP